MKLNFIIISLIIVKITFFCMSAQAAVLRVVAAESVYGELAKQLGGEDVQVKSILNSPAQDPHLFSATPSIARAVADADIVIYSGLGYDEWMTRLIGVSRHTKAHIILVADLTGKKPGDNPHLWYDPIVMPILAQALTNEFKRRDPQNEKAYEQRLHVFQRDYQKLIERIQTLKQKFHGMSVIATEPVFQYMADALGLQMLGMDLQMSMMNHTAPSPKQLKQFEDALTQRQARVMMYNQQVNQPLTERLQVLAHAANIPTVGVTEMQPAGISYRQWMEKQLVELTKAYDKSN
jgi:zinc/manganese transport system substrate-binding protein